MPTHSLDLRQRIVAAYQAGGTSIREVAKRFMVTKRTVHRLVQQYKQTQDLTPKKVGTKRVGILEQNQVEILAIVEEYPDKCLWQYVEIQSFPLLWGTVATFGKPICKRRRINQ
jgi:transposase